jgi:hypothetical protein
VLPLVVLLLLCCTQACVPVASRLPSFRVQQQLYEGEAAAWQLQAHAAALQIVLMESCMDAPPAKVRHRRIVDQQGVGSARCLSTANFTRALLRGSFK